MTERQYAWARRIALLFAGLFLMLQGCSMVFHAGRGIFRYTTRIVVPPALVSGEIVSYRRTVETAHAFVALGIFPSYHEAFPASLAFILRDKRLRDMGVEVSDTALAEIVLSSEQEAALRTAHISLREQKKYIQTPLARFRSATQLRDTERPSQEMRLANIQEKLTLGMPFADVARYFSEDQSAVDGGDLGVFLLSELPEWLSAVREMELEETRADFVGADAFWIIKKGDEGTGEDGEWVRLRGIAINKPSIGSLLRTHAEEHPAWIFVW